MTNRRSRTTTIGAISVVLAISAAACGSSKTPVAAPTSAAAAKGFDAAVKSVENPSTKTGGTLNFVATSDVDSFDGARSYYANTWNLQRLFTRSLMGFDAKVGPAGALAVPDLATSKGQISTDGLTVTYTLRDGIKFQDGSAITSKDIKYGVERSFAQSVLPGGPTYLHDLLDGVNGEKYLGPYKDTDPNHLGLKAVETPDDKTIVFHLNKAFADFDYLMALPTAAPVPAAVDQDPAKGGAKYQFNVVADGPYMFQSYDPGKSVVWVKNPNWSKATDPIRSQLVDKIILTQGLDADEMDKRLLSGAADIEIEGSGVQAAAQAKILTTPDIKANADDPTTGFTRYFAINQTVPELSNIHCRMAVEYATDKVALQNARGGPVGGGQIATNLAPPALPGFKALNPYPSGADNTGDLVKAKAELAACGVPNGFHTNIATSNKGKGPKVAAALQQGLARVGIVADVQASDASTYFSTTVGTPSNVHAKDLGIITAGWGADFPTGFGFFSSILDGRKILTAGGNSNYQELNDPAINTMLDQLTTETDQTKRLALVSQIDEKTMATATILPFTWDAALTYRNPRVTNVYVTGAFGMYDNVSMGVSDGK